MRGRIREGRTRIGSLQRDWRFASFTLAVLAAGCGFIIIASLRRTLAQGELARRDPLTGLLNRRGFNEAAHLLLRRAERDGVQMTLMVFDLDGFKAVNDIQGHAAGDRLLRDLGIMLEKTARRTDLVARLGGDEFAVLLEHSKGEGPSAAVRRLRDEIRDRLDELGWPVTLSVGAVNFMPGYATLTDLEAQADRLMYDAKKSGKNTIRIDEPFRPPE
jgi:diguanylate cyclase (GGDEF)-like protein